MEKLLKVLLLKDQWLLASVEEIEDVEFGDPDCILHRPMFVDGLLTITLVRELPDKQKRKKYF